MNKAILLILPLFLMHIGPSYGQKCFSDVPRTTPTTQFISNANGTTLDKNTGLVWKRCVEGQSWNGSTCLGSAKTFTWQQALQAGNNAVFAGKSDWRVPNAKELVSIHEWSCVQPDINLSIFPNFPNYPTWSSTPYPNDNSSAFTGGADYQSHYWEAKADKYNLLLVRDNQ